MMMISFCNARIADPSTPDRALVRVPLAMRPVWWGKRGNS
jgi:hypothetical protein